ncbi:MAG: DNA mismatch repair endonuclease MutH [Succinivibrio sp.]|nr:DNA mismatch repair endonuclease MutH [Succinivibrio sp.]
MVQTPPESFEELIERLNRITGLSISEIAADLNVNLPISTTRGKGFTGELLEVVLGASAKNQSIPDFPELGLELKTLPIDQNFKPLESTFVCHAPLMNVRDLRFENSPLYAKIKRVLFILIDGTKGLEYSEKYIRGYFFYTPTENDLLTLKKDFDELYELIKTGEVESITARIGHIVQLRPKGADGTALTQAIGKDGQIIMTRPRGFYIRRSFTQELIERNNK